MAFDQLCLLICKVGLEYHWLLLTLLCSYLLLYLLRLLCFLLLLVLLLLLDLLCRVLLLLGLLLLGLLLRVLLTLVFQIHVLTLTVLSYLWSSIVDVFSIWPTTSSIVSASLYLIVFLLLFDWSSSLLFMLNSILLHVSYPGTFLEQTNETTIYFLHLMSQVHYHLRPLLWVLTYWGNIFVYTCFRCACTIMYTIPFFYQYALGNT